MNREPEIEALLNAARDAAIAALEGVQATPIALRRLAATAREAVLVQADLGMWSKWTIAGRADFANLECEAELDRLLARPIILRWRFLRTPLRYLETI